MQAPDVRLVIGRAVRQADRAGYKKATHAPPPVRAYVWGSHKNISSFFVKGSSDDEENEFGPGQGD